MVWPSPQDYSEAVQMARTSFQDDDLKNGAVETNSLGLPTCASGNFASVFCLSNDKRKFAARCFLHDVPDQEHRYSEISKFILADDLPYTVSFEYLSDGIKVQERWYPLLKMQWVDGITLNQYISENYDNSQALNLLAGYFKQMMFELHRAGIAHGDLQHDNILVSDDELRLVDYDGMFVPALAGHTANELGHRNYQHPQRDKSTFGPFLDNFSAWIIYASLKSLAVDPSLWKILKGGDDCLLFRRSDFISKGSDGALSKLSKHSNEHIRTYAAVIESFLKMPIESIPGLETSIDVEHLQASNVWWAPEVTPEVTPEVVADAEPPEEMVVALPVVRQAYPIGPLTILKVDNAVLQLGSSQMRDSITSQLNADEDIVWEFNRKPPAVTYDATAIGSLAAVMMLFVFIVSFHSVWAIPGCMLVSLLLLVPRPKTFQKSNWCYLTNVRFLMIESSLSGSPKVYSLPFDQISKIEKIKSGVILRPRRHYMLTPGGFSEDLSIQLPPEREKTLLEKIPNTVPRSA
jgi:serine/threonine protein kinase